MSALFRWNLSGQNISWGIFVGPGDTCQVGLLHEGVEGNLKLNWRAHESDLEVASYNNNEIAFYQGQLIVS